MWGAGLAKVRKTERERERGKEREKEREREREGERERQDGQTMSWMPADTDRQTDRWKIHQGGRNT